MVQDFIEYAQYEWDVPLFSKHNFTKMVDDHPVRFYYNPYNLELKGVDNKSLEDIYDYEVKNLLKSFIDEGLFADTNSKFGVPVDKSVFEKVTGIHITHSQFMDAMIEVGFAPVCVDAFTWKYRVSLESPWFLVNKLDSVPFRDHKRFMEVFHFVRKFKTFARPIKANYIRSLELELEAKDNGRLMPKHPVE